MLNEVLVKVIVVKLGCIFDEWNIKGMGDKTEYFSSDCLNFVNIRFLDSVPDLDAIGSIGY